MKIHLKFDHSQDSTIKAISCESDEEQLQYQTLSVIKQFKEKTKVSELCELIHDNFDYEFILLLAAKNIEEAIKQMVIQELKDELKDLLGL